MSENSFLTHLCVPCSINTFQASGHQMMSQYVRQKDTHVPPCAYDLCTFQNPKWQWRASTACEKAWWCNSLAGALMKHTEKITVSRLVEQPESTQSAALKAAPCLASSPSPIRCCCRSIPPSWPFHACPLLISRFTALGDLLLSFSSCCLFSDSICFFHSFSRLACCAPCYSVFHLSTHPLICLSPSCNKHHGCRS